MIKWYCQRNVNDYLDGHPLYKAYPVDMKGRFCNNRKTVLFDDFKYDEHTEFVTQNQFPGFIYSAKINCYPVFNTRSNTTYSLLVYLNQYNVWLSIDMSVSDMFMIMSQCQITHGNISESLWLSFSNKEYFINVKDDDGKYSPEIGECYHIVQYADNQLYLGKFKATENTNHYHFGDISNKSYYVFLKEKSRGVIEISLYKSVPKIRPHVELDSFLQYLNYNHLHTSDGMLDCYDLKSKVQLDMNHKTFTLV